MKEGRAHAMRAPFMGGALIMGARCIAAKHCKPVPKITGFRPATPVFIDPFERGAGDLFRYTEPHRRSTLGRAFCIPPVHFRCTPGCSGSVREVYRTPDQGLTCDVVLYT